jgi:undecaprenyl diphosphate synthase
VRRAIPYLTVFSFSSENWSRPPHEIHGLMKLLKIFIRGDLAELRSNNVRIRVIGERAGLPLDIRSLLDHAEEATQKNQGLQLIVAFNYGSRNEILRAVRKLAARAAVGEISPDEIDSAVLAGTLDTAGIPDPDLVIRTSGEQRISNFLLWQSAYAELVFLPVLWPDFSDEDFETALRHYAGRERRYGAVVAG